MAIINTFQCDGCKVQKQASNNWWVAYRDASLVLTVTMFDNKEGGVEYQEAVNHLCGIECTQKWLGQRMQEVMGQ